MPKGYPNNGIRTSGIKKGHKMSEETKRKMSESAKGKHHSEETKEKIRIAKKKPENVLKSLKSLKMVNNWGENNPRWKGGVDQYIKQKARVRDDYTCQICGLRDPEIMEVDHIIPKSKAEHLAFALDNLMTICPNCHRRKTNRELKSNFYA